ncbi:GntR family transcriptional regulator [Nocardiopsis sediminis]|uniref:GntR family transcriptional regulator n=1 Tax=Nocardiopsis sediminis TaxID=1778267 RepID=A0ABV8FQN1_9ACTN
MARWHEIAHELRAAIAGGDVAPGDVLPRETDLQERYRTSRTTVRQAVAALEKEGLVEKVRRRGTVVRRPPTRRRIPRSRRVHRDGIGYYFDTAAQGWRPLEPPAIGRVPAPADIARLLGLPAATEVVTRSRVMGDPGSGDVTQLATSYLAPAAVDELPVLAEPDTGPGGIYDRMEEAGHGPLRWEEAVSARMPSPDEARRLSLPPGVPVLRITRITRGADGRALEVNDTRVSAERFEVVNEIDRDPTAAPRNPPVPSGPPA